MTAWEIRDSLSFLTDWGEDEEDMILALCKSSLKEIESMLKADTDRTDARISAAAAANAYCKLSLKRSFSSSKDEITNFKAGDVSITQSSADNSKMLDKAEKLYQNAMQNLIPLCKDNGFAFENVKIKVML